MKKKTKKCVKIYKKTVTKVTRKLLKNRDNEKEIMITGKIVCDMIDSFTEYLFSFDEVMTEKEHEVLSNIVNDNLLKISGKVDSYIPETEDLLYISMKLSKMVIKTNKILLK